MGSIGNGQGNPTGPRLFDAARERFNYSESGQASPARPADNRSLDPARERFNRARRPTIMTGKSQEKSTSGGDKTIGSSGKTLGN